MRRADSARVSASVRVQTMRERWPYSTSRASWWELVSSNEGRSSPNSSSLIHEPTVTASFGGLPLGASVDDAPDLVADGLEVAQAGSERGFRSARVSNSRLWVARRLSFFRNRSIGLSCGL